MIKKFRFTFIAFTLLLFACLIAYTGIFQLNNDSIKNKTKEKAVSKDLSYISPYTGKNISKEAYNNIPFMAIIENSKPARPQSGLSDADIVYETLAEGGITRFFALFHSSSPGIIGPIRSVRPYFITLSLQYSLPFAHCGGSPEALDRIEKENLMSLNELHNGNYYWRDSSRKAPHNLYTSSEKIRSLIADKKQISPPSIFTNFNSKLESNSELEADDISIKFNKSYTTTYHYENGLYYKYMDGEEAIDKLNNSPITAETIVIQFSDMQVRDDLRLNMGLIGAGTAYIINGEKYESVTWEKKDEKSQVVFKNDKNKIISLPKGNIWWHIINKDSSVEIG